MKSSSPVGLILTSIDWIRSPPNLLPKKPKRSRHQQWKEMQQGNKSSLKRRQILLWGTNPLEKKFIQMWPMWSWSKLQSQLKETYWKKCHTTLLIFFAGPKMCHSRKVENGVDYFFFFFCDPYFWIIVCEKFWPVINPKPLDTALL